MIHLTTSYHQRENPINRENEEAGVCSTVCRSQIFLLSKDPFGDLFLERAWQRAALHTRSRWIYLYCIVLRTYPYILLTHSSSYPQKRSHKIFFPLCRELFTRSLVGKFSFKACWVVQAWINFIVWHLSMAQCESAQWKVLVKPFWRLQSIFGYYNGRRRRRFKLQPLLWEKLRRLS